MSFNTRVSKPPILFQYQRIKTSYRVSRNETDFRRPLREERKVSKDNLTTGRNRKGANVDVVKSETETTVHRKRDTLTEV